MKLWQNSPRDWLRGRALRNLCRTGGTIRRIAATESFVEPPPANVSPPPPAPPPPKPIKCPTDVDDPLSSAPAAATIHTRRRETVIITAHILFSHSLRFTAALRSILVQMLTVCVRGLYTYCYSICKFAGQQIRLEMWSAVHGRSTRSGDATLRPCSAEGSVFGGLQW